MKVDRVSIRDVLDHYGIDYKDAPEKDELLYLCPFHDDEHFGSAFFNEEQRTWFCFSCNRGGNDVQFVAELEDVSTSDAWQLLTTEFSGRRDYDKLFKDRKAVERSPVKITKREFDKTVESAVRRILQILSSHKGVITPEKVAYWLRVCAWLNSIPWQEVANRYNQVFEVYEFFSQEFLAHDLFGKD